MPVTHPEDQDLVACNNRCQRRDEIDLCSWCLSSCRSTRLGYFLELSRWVTSFQPGFCRRSWVHSSKASLVSQRRSLRSLWFLIKEASVEITVGLIFVYTVSKSSRANVASLAICCFTYLPTTYQHTLSASCGCVAAAVASDMAELWLLSGSPLNLKSSVRVSMSRN